MLSFHNYLKTLRSQVGLSQRETANLAGLNPSEISRLESGERGIRLDRDILIRIGGAFGLDEDGINLLFLHGELAPLGTNDPEEKERLVQIREAQAKLKESLAEIKKPRRRSQEF